MSHFNSVQFFVHFEIENIPPQRSHLAVKVMTIMRLAMSSKSGMQHITYLSTLFQRVYIFNKVSINELCSRLYCASINIKGTSNGLGRKTAGCSLQ